MLVRFHPEEFAALVGISVFARAQTDEILRHPRRHIGTYSYHNLRENQ